MLKKQTKHKKKIKREKKRVYLTVQTKNCKLKIPSNAYFIKTRQHLLIMLHPQRAADCNLVSCLHHFKGMISVAYTVKGMETTICTFQACITSIKIRTTCLLMTSNTMFTRIIISNSRDAKHQKCHAVN